MKLTLKIKLLPKNDQENSLKKTIESVNAACNFISNVAWENRTYNSVKLQHLVYYKVKDSYPLSAQLIIRSIAKVSDSYKKDKKTKREFFKYGAIAYDSRILSYKNGIASLSTIDGRIKMPFVCHNQKMIPFIKGEADLVYRKGKFYLFQTVDIPDEEVKDVEDFLGIDFGQTDIAVTSKGEKFSSNTVKEVRKHYAKVRASMQSKGTKGSKKALKRLSGKEARFVSIENHRISKQLVAQAKYEGVGIAIEDLSGIRKTAEPKSSKMKTELNRWSFYQLRMYLTYKSKKSGIPLVVIPPAYTSQTCNCCMHRGVEESFRNGKNFVCKNCGNVADADVNAALNIAAWGRLINRPEKSPLVCQISDVHVSEGLKPLALA
jgi:IS605 OrfB family transposase